MDNGSAIRKGDAAGDAPSSRRPEGERACADVVPPVIATGAGQGLDFQNSDVLPHDVVSQDVDGAGNPIFRSPVTPGGAQVLAMYQALRE